VVGKREGTGARTLGTVAPPSEQLTGTRQLRQVVLRPGIAVEQRTLGAFLDIEHELQGKPRSPWPLGIGRMTAVALEISGMPGVHR
jgi:hypothetical protein